MARPDRSDRLYFVIATLSFIEVLRRPFEFTQYASQEYRKALAELRIVCSMSRKANCWDNAVAEAFFSTLKLELIYRREWNTRAETSLAIAEYIECFYNTQRRHSYLDFKSPAEHERLHAIGLIAA